MDFKEYQEKAYRTVPDLIKDELLTNAILGICGESGEIADVYKKAVYQGHGVNSAMMAKLAEEAGDLLWYISLLATTIGLGLEDIAAMNIAKLQKRYPEGFDPERSINRKSS